MKEIVFRVLSYIIEYMKLMPISFIFFGIPTVSARATVLISVLITIMVGILSAFGGIFITTPFIALLLMINAVSLMRYKKDAVAIPIIYLYICIIDMIINGFIMFSLDINVESISQDSIQYLLLNSPMIAVAFILCALKLRKKNKKVYRVPKKYLILTSVSAVMIILYLTSVQLWAFNSSVEKKARLTAILLGCSSIVFVVIISLMIVKAVQNESLKRENIISGRLVSSWEKYYVSIMNNEKELKAFRHDIRGHLLAIKHMSDEKKVEEINGYVDKMLDIINNSSRKFDTGNGLVNALMNDISSGYPDVNFTVKGHLPDELNVSSYDICTMLYNIFSNAFEAANKCETKQVDALFEILEACVVIIVENTSEKAPAVYDGEYVSSKSEKGHGFGIDNVIRCSKENGGKFSLKYKEGKVRCVLTLPGAILCVN